MKKYVYFVSYGHVSENGQWGFGRAEIFFKEQINCMADIAEIESKIIKDATEKQSHSFKAMVVLNFQLLRTENE